jgi:Cu(I)/Ag(I) efflux system membrane fusion protein
MLINAKSRIMKTILTSLIIITALAVSSCTKQSPARTGQADSSAARHAAEYYTCPMHHQIHADKPGQCPICHMDLVKVSDDGGEKAADTSSVSISDRGQQLANVATVAVRMESIEHTIRASGLLEIPEPNKAMISARFSGRVEKLYVQAVGATVKKGQPLFDIYSPDIVQAENDYLQAFNGGGTIASDVRAGSGNGTSGGQAPLSLLSASRSKLQLFGFTEEQIRGLESNGRSALVFTYHSPASGTVVDKKIVEGMYVSEGLPLFEISDLSTLWNIADVYETDASALRVGDKASIRLQTPADRSYPAVVSFIYPVVNPQSRTVKVRLALANAGGALRPNAYTETFFTLGRGTALTVPVTAVLVTGKRNIVYVKTGGNQFASREVGLGVRFNGKYEITRGLQPGEIIVSEGGYLIDSESQLKSGNGL